MNAIRTTDKILLIGIGNYGRADDALGWRFADEFSAHSDLFDIEYRYQLQVEDAELITQYKQVIFVDAHHGALPNGFSYYECKATPAENFTTHTLAPENVLWIANELFGYSPTCYVMAIAGTYWELRNGMSEEATENLKAALRFFKKLYVTKSVFNTAVPIL
jgi:hydrogenase maturation protease